MVWHLALGLLLALVGLTQALPDPEIRLLEDLIAAGQVDLRDLQGISKRDLQVDLRDLQGISKRDLEFNQYVPAYRLRGEPSCEELRAMWRLSKREARRATSTNNLPRSRPYNYGRLFAFAPNPHQRQFAYGEPRNFASHKSLSFSPVKGSFDRLRGMLGAGAGRPGSFQRVRGMVASQRQPGDSPKGKLDELRGMVLGGTKSSPPGDMESETSLRSAEIYQPVRRTPPDRYVTQRESSQDSKEGFVGALMPGYDSPDPISPVDVSEWRLRPWDTQQQNSCIGTSGAHCQSDSECACAGQYRCSKGRCKVLPVHPDLKDTMGIWYSGPIAPQDLGTFERQERWSP